jgi:hypothetical protein
MNAALIFNAVRRVRVFLLPWERPKNIMRELRARILAIEWIEAVSYYFKHMISNVV